MIAAAVVVGRREAEHRTDGHAASSPDEVLERVAPRQRDPQAAELARLRDQLAQSPRDEALAERFSLLAIAAGRRRGDPRYLGQAEAALAPWWQSPSPPEAIHLLRATLRQARHDFTGALTDLDGILTRAPKQAQARLTRAVVLTVLGRHTQAQRDCQLLPPAASPLVRAACAAPAAVAQATSDTALAEALKPLDAALTSADLHEQSWGLSLRGELRFWAGQRAAAEQDLRRALALDPGERYTRGVYADLLLDAGRSREVSDLLAGSEEDDALLLRLALAETRLGSGRAPELTRQLGERFTAARARGDATHLREEARFSLELAADPRRALDLALASWQVQQEPWDARLVLQSARAAGQIERAAAVAEQVRQRVGWSTTTAGALALATGRAR